MKTKLLALGILILSSVSKVLAMDVSTNYLKENTSTIEKIGDGGATCFMKATSSTENKIDEIRNELKLKSPEEREKLLEKIIQLIEEENN